MNESPSAAAHVVVVGGGISGLVAAERLLSRPAVAHVTILEAAPRLGGVIGTERTDGFVMERGPDVVLAAKPATRDLAERLGVADRMCGTAAHGSYVYRDGALHRVPEGLQGLVPTRMGPFAATRLLSWRGKARMAAELFVPPRRDEADESIADFVVRRLGAEAFESLVEPLLGGIFAGDARRLGVLGTFPQLRALEREHGGLVRAALARRAAGARPAPGGTPFLTFPGGLGELIEALQRALERDARVSIRTGTPVRTVLPLPGGGGARVVLADGAVIRADAAVVATPAHEAARLLSSIDPTLGGELASIAHASTATVTLALPRAAVPHALDATGYVVPRAAGRRALACTWVSSKFAGRAPEGTALFRVFFGGAGRDGDLAGDDAALLAAARAELRETLGATGEPLVSRVVRWERTMPQYEVGHRDRVARIEAIAARYPALALAGNAYRGVGIPDCIATAERAADRLAGVLAERGSVAVAS